MVVFQIGHVFASTEALSLTNVEIVSNRSEDYTIKSISDNNTNAYITYEYGNYAGTKINSNEEKNLI